MRRLARRLFTFAAAVSLLLLLGVCVLWVRGFFAQDEWRASWGRLERHVVNEGDFYFGMGGCFATSGRGGLAVGVRSGWAEMDHQALDLPLGTRFSHDRYDPAYPIHPESDRPADGVQHTLAGFQFRTAREPGTGKMPLLRDGEYVMDANGDIVWATPRFSLDEHETLVVVPVWVLAIAFAVLPVIWTRASRRRRQLSIRQGRGDCLACGYPLRSGGGHARCPECGTAAAAA